MEDTLLRAALLGYNAAELTRRICTYFPTQIPETFCILEVPEQVVLDLYSRLQRMTVKKPSHQ